MRKQASRSTELFRARARIKISPHATKPGTSARVLAESRTIDAWCSGQLVLSNQEALKGLQVANHQSGELLKAEQSLLYLLQVTFERRLLDMLSWL